MSKPRNLLATQTVIGGWMSLASVIALLAVNTFDDTAKRHYPDHAKTIDEIVSFVNQVSTAVGAAGFGVTAHGRHKATVDVYTSKFLPGRDKDRTV